MAANHTKPSATEAVEPIHHLSLAAPPDRFDKAVQAAAQAGKITNSEPLVRQLNSTMRVLTGLSVLINIVGNNPVLKEQFDPQDQDSIPPLSPYATSVLLNLAAEICEISSNDICSLASWTETHIASQGGK